MTMPGYVKKILKEFQHEQPQKRQDSPYIVAPKRYGTKSQVMDKPEEFREVDAAEKKFTQQVTGKFIYLGQAIDGTLLTSLSVIASKQSSPNEDTLNRTPHFLDYVAPQEDAILTYPASDMILAVYSDASYNNMPEARSRAVTGFYNLYYVII